MKHFVIYSHGFGVDKTDRGLMTDIASSLPEFDHVLFDYNEVDSDKNVLRINPLPEQVRRLRARIDDVRSKSDSDAIIDIVAHSQGCIIAALARPKNMRNIIFLAPPGHLSIDQMKHIFGARPGSVINLDGESRIPRKDGSTTIIPKEYWGSIQGLNIIQLYNYLPIEARKVHFYIATDDEVLGSANFDQTSRNIEITPIRSDHDFNGLARSEIIKLLGASLMQ